MNILQGCVVPVKPQRLNEIYTVLLSQTIFHWSKKKLLQL